MLGVLFTRRRVCCLCRRNALKCRSAFTMSRCLRWLRSTFLWRAPTCWSVDSRTSCVTRRSVRSAKSPPCWCDHTMIRHDRSIEIDFSLCDSDQQIIECSSLCVFAVVLPACRCFCQVCGFRHQAQSARHHRLIMRKSKPLLRRRRRLPHLRRRLFHRLHCRLVPRIFA